MQSAREEALESLKELKQLNVELTKHESMDKCDTTKPKYISNPIEMTLLEKGLEKQKVPILPSELPRPSGNGFINFTIFAICLVVIAVIIKLSVLI